MREDVLRTARQISEALGHDPQSRRTVGIELALPNTALAEPRYHAEDEQGHPKYQTRDQLEKADREFKREQRRLEREQEAQQQDLARRYAEEDEDGR